MKKIFISMLALAAVVVVHANKRLTVTVRSTEYQKITGFGAADCDGAMRPFGTDTQPVSLLYGSRSKIGLNILRMESSPNFKGNITAANVGWDTP